MHSMERVYMVGIGGIGMSALAQLLLTRGKAVSGSDRESSPTTELLAEKGIRVAIGAGELPEDAELLIYSDAVPSSDPARSEAARRGVPELSYFEALDEVSRGMKTVAVAGTHGKTTTTGMIAKILSDSGAAPTAIVGSIVRDFPGPTGGSNFLAGSSDIFVVEACEYRDHLLKLTPEILVITNLELDHTDYFPDLAALQDSFRKAVAKVPEHGVIVTDPEHPHVAPILASARARIVDYTKKAIGDLAQIGEFNRMNARAALAAAEAASPGLSAEAAVRSLADFKGSWRRFEYKGTTPRGALVYDDYAHHPTAISATLVAARERFPDKRIVVAFHAHTYSRTRSFLQEFGSALALSYETVVAPIYAAREPDDPAMTNETIAEVVRRHGGSAVALNSFDDIRERLLTYDDRHLIITMGAGDIYKVADQIAD